MSHNNTNIVKKKHTRQNALSQVSLKNFAGFAEMFFIDEKNLSEIVED